MPAIHRLLIALMMATFVVVPSAQANHSVLDLISIGPDGGNANAPASFQGASEDGTHVFFRTDESLVAADTDDAFDVYERTGTTTRLVSVGSQPGFGLDGYFTRATPDGSHVFFHTRDQLVPQDTNSTDDVYERFNGTTSLATSQISGLTFHTKGGTADESRVFVSTTRQLSGADTDTNVDIYRRDGGTNGTFTLISPSPLTGPSSDVTFNGTSADGSTVFFTTAEQLVLADTDTSRDVYVWNSGAASLISTGPAGGNGAYDASFGGTTPDGSHVYFQTNESMIAFPDDDTYQDVYERVSGVTKLVSYGPNSFDGSYDASFDAVSADGLRVYFETAEPLVAADTNGQKDFYERSSNTTKQITYGPTRCVYTSPPCYSTFAGISQDGSRLYTSDLGYAWCGGYTWYKQNVVMYDTTTRTQTVLSPTNSDCDRSFEFQRISPDGSRVLWGYSSSSGPTWEWTSSGGSVQIQADNYRASAADAGRVLFDTSSSRVAADTDGAQDIYAISVAGSGPSSTAYPRPLAASPLSISLVPAFKPCTGPNATHAAPLSHPSCSPPELTSENLTVGTFDANGQNSNFKASLKLAVIAGSPSVPGDQSDNKLTLSATDIRNKDLSDYTGELRIQTTVRTTDKLNGASGTAGATVEDFPLSVVAGCDPTGSTAIGSTCQVTTTLDTLGLGNVVIEGARTVTHLEDVRVYDGGADGDGDTTGDNTLFAWEGVFTP